MSFAAMMLAEGLWLNELLTLKIENSLISLVGTRIPTVSMMEWQFILPLKTLIRMSTPDSTKNGEENFPTIRRKIYLISTFGTN
jgi:hypothetical protein